MSAFPMYGQDWIRCNFETFRILNFIPDPDLKQMFIDAVTEKSHEFETRQQCLDYYATVDAETIPGYQRERVESLWAPTAREVAGTEKDVSEHYRAWELPAGGYNPSRQDPPRSHGHPSNDTTRHEAHSAPSDNRNRVDGGSRRGRDDGSRANPQQSTPRPKLDASGRPFSPYSGWKQHLGNKLENPRCTDPPRSEWAL